MRPYYVCQVVQKNKRERSGDAWVNIGCKSLLHVLHRHAGNDSLCGKSAQTDHLISLEADTVDKTMKVDFAQLLSKYMKANILTEPKSLAIENKRFVEESKRLKAQIAPLLQT